MVFCTGGRTRSGAEARLPELPETAFACIGDFIAESLAVACRCDMREIVVACMPGKLCKYAAGFENTHAHKVSQDMDLLRAEVRRTLPAETALHKALERSVSVREALLSLPEAARPQLLRRLARVALDQFARRCTGNPTLRLLVFDFEGGFLFEETREPDTLSEPRDRTAASCAAPAGRGNGTPGADGNGLETDARFAETDAGPEAGSGTGTGAEPDEASPASAEPGGTEGVSPRLADPAEIVGPSYFMQGAGK